MNKDWIKNSPWSNEQEFLVEMQQAWEEMKTIGIKSGVLTQRPDGAIIGNGDPNRWFDQVEKDKQNV